MYQDYLDAPIGFPKPYISITANEKGITSLYFVNDKDIAVNSSTVIKQCIKQLKEYFAGNSYNFFYPVGAREQNSKVEFGKHYKLFLLAKFGVIKNWHLH